MKCPKCKESMQTLESRKQSENTRIRRYKCKCGVRLILAVTIKAEILSISGQDRVA